MALTVNKEIGGSSTGAMSSEGLTKKYTAIYQVLSDDAEIGPRTAIDEVFSTQGITYLSPYSTQLENDTSTYLVNVSTSHEEDGRLWRVTLEYTNKLDFDPDQTPDNPLSRPAKLRFGTNLVRKTFRRDKDNQSVVTSAGMPMDQLPAFDEARPTFTIQKNRAATLDAITHANNVGHVNSTSYLGFSPKTLRCTDGSSEGPQFENGIEYWVWSFTFEYAPIENFRVHQGIGSTGTAGDIDVSGWDVAVLNAGYKQLNVSDELISCKDSDEQDATDPMPLSEIGGQLLIPTTENLIGYKVFRVYDEADFNTLAIWP